jgi:hypothetical protein
LINSANPPWLIRLTRPLFKSVGGLRLSYVESSDTCSHRHSLNNQCELEGSGIVAGRKGRIKAHGRSGLASTSSSEEKVGDTFGTVCPLSVLLQLRPELLQLAGQDIPGSVATSK